MAEAHPTIFAAAFNPVDPTTAVFAGDYGQAYVYKGAFTSEVELVPGADPNLERHRLDLVGHDVGEEVIWADWSADGSRILTVGARTASVWSSADGFAGHYTRDYFQDAPPGAEWLAADFGPDGVSMFAVAAFPDKPAAGVLRPTWHPGDLDVHAPPVSAHCNTDGRVLVASADGARPWQVHEWTHEWTPLLEKFIMRHDGDQVNSARWSVDGGEPEGMWAVTASDDGSARVWYPWDPSAPLAVLTEPGMGQVGYAEFCPANANIVVTASSDGAVRIWKWDSGPRGTEQPRLLHRWDDRSHPVHWEGHPDEELWLNCARFSHDGKKVIAAYENGWAAVRSVPAGLPI